MKEQGNGRCRKDAHIQKTLTATISDQFDTMAHKGALNVIPLLGNNQILSIAPKDSSYRAYNSRSKSTTTTSSSFSDNIPPFAGSAHGYKSMREIVMQ